MKSNGLNYDQKMKYPKSVFFIVIYQFCERLSYFGMLVILPLYFVDILKYDENTATVMFHVLIIFSYFFPLVGAIVADSWLGKFSTIFYLTVFYAIGQILLLASSIPMLQFAVREISTISLLVIIAGAGCVKPCISAFGGDQFQLPQQAAYLATFFSIFYVAVNAGAVLSMLTTPILRKDVTCYGENTCYPLAFSVSAVFMVVSLLAFFTGKKFCTIKRAEGNIVLKVVRCASHAISNKMRSNERRDHWLDHADDMYDCKLIEDIKSALKVLKLFLPLPIFWTLYDQQSTRWLFQTSRTNGEVLGYAIKADQFQVVNAIFVLILVPLYQYVIYPIIEKFFFINTPLRKMTTGGLLASLALAISGVFELALEPTYAVQPSSGLAQVRIFNYVNCSATLTLDRQRYVLPALDVYENLTIPVTGTLKMDLEAEFENCSENFVPNFNLVTSLEVEEANATTWILTDHGISSPIHDPIEKSNSGDPKVRVLTSMYTGTMAPLILQSYKDSYTINTSINTQLTDFTEVNHNSYRLKYYRKDVTDEDITLKFGGVYTLIAYISNQHQIKLITHVEPNSIHMFWLIPQYLIMTMGEIMFTVTGIEFAYSQAPDSMKSLMQAAWFLTGAFGNLIIVVVAKVQFFDRQVYEFFLFALLMLVDMIIFAIMAKFYKYVEITSSNEELNDRNSMQMQEKHEASNPAYVNDS